MSPVRTSTTFRGAWGRSSQPPGMPLASSCIRSFRPRRRTWQRSPVQPRLRAQMGFRSSTRSSASRWTSGPPTPGFRPPPGASWARPLKPIALAAVYDCYAATGLPIVGMGGIASGRDALEFVAAGAADIALGAILFSDPGPAARIQAELASEVAALGVGAVDNVI